MANLTFVAGDTWVEGDHYRLESGDPADPRALDFAVDESGNVVSTRGANGGRPAAYPETFTLRDDVDGRALYRVADGVTLPE